MKKEFSSIKSQINHMKQYIQRLEQIANNLSSTSSPPHIISTSVNNDLKTQANKLKLSIEDTNNYLSGIYASIVTLAKSFGAPLSEQWQLQFPSHFTSSSSPSHITIQSKSTISEENIDAESSFSHQPSKISTDLSFPKSHD